MSLARKQQAFTPVTRASMYGRVQATRLDEIKNFHLTDSIDTERLSTRGRSVWVHSSQVRLLGSSVPHNSLPEREGSVGTGAASKLGTESRLPFSVRI